jgi:hypothetical protein
LRGIGIQEDAFGGVENAFPPPRACQIRSGRSLVAEPLATRHRWPSAFAHSRRAGCLREGVIAILPGQSKIEEFSKLVHELAHEMLHKAERRTATTKVVRETEAEVE